MGSMFSPGGTETAGDIKFHSANAIPPGWLKADGAAVSRTAYAALFAAIGTTYGAGDGATTFALPDLRGEFLRGFDDGRAVDSGRMFGSAQGHDLVSHTHAVNVRNDRSTASGAEILFRYDYPTGTQRTSATGGSETRPRNVAMLACIKY